jgi:thymidylate kinase
MRIVTISGVDGSGKSTQLSLLREKLEREGKKAFYFHAVEFSLANRLARVMRGKKGFTPGSEKASTKASWLSLRLRKAFLLLDILRFKGLARRLEREGYDYLVSDRYFYDSAVNILYLSKDGGKGGLWLERFIPKPDYAFYMDIGPEEVMRRDRVPEQGSGYVRKKISLYREKSVAWSMVPVDAARNKEEVYAEISKNVSRL